MRHIIFNYGILDREQEIKCEGKEEGDVFKLLLNHQFEENQYVIHYFSFAYKHIDLFKNGQSEERTEVVSKIFNSIVSQTNLLKRSGEDILLLLHMGKESDLSFVYENCDRIGLPSVRYFHGGSGPVYEKIIDEWTSKWVKSNPELLPEKFCDLEEVWNYYFLDSKSDPKL